MKLKMLFINGFLILVGMSMVPVSTEALIATCPGDYYNFIVTARSEATRKQTFKDFFSLGSCQLNDILPLEDELDAIRENFRIAANSCQNTSEYKKQYHEILMEEYFIRNIQKSGPGAINEVDVEKLETLKEAKLDALQKEMMELFVNEEQRVSEAVFNAYFETWSSQYDDRIANYARCEEGAWAELNETWQDFIEDIRALNIEVEKETFSFTLAPEVINESDWDSSAGKDMGGMGKNTQGSYEYLKAKKEQREAAIPPAQTIKEVADSGRSVSFQEAIRTFSNSGQVLSIQSNAASRMANYELLYGAGGAVAATDMQSVLVYMNAVLQETNTKDFPNIAKASAQIYGKECR